MNKNNEMQATGLQLTRNMGSNEVKTYFDKVFELKQSGKEFPVNLDEVWPLVYAQKGKALATLKSDFVEGDDFYLSQMGKVVTFNELQNGVKINAFLSVSCLEYFIARKEKTIFDVYRTVFHKTINQLQEQKNETEGGWLYYKNSCRRIGLSTDSGTYWRRPQQYPNEFKHDETGRALVSSTFFLHLKKSVELRAELKQIASRNPKHVETNIQQQLSLFDDNERISLLTLATQIQDKAHRMSIVNKLIGGKQ